MEHKIDSYLLYGPFSGKISKDTPKKIMI